MSLPPEVLARVVHWLYQSGDKLTATRLLISHKNPELKMYCENLEQPIVFFINITSNQYQLTFDETTYTDILVDWDGVWTECKGYIECASMVLTPWKHRIRIYPKSLKGLKFMNNIVEFPTIGNVITSLSYMFYNTSINIPLIWDTSMITDMRGTFKMTCMFNQRLVWNTSNVKDMDFMFAGATSFNQPLSFNTSSCKTMCCMFENAKSFNQPLDFDTSSVEDMSYMFSGAKNFNQPLNWNTSSVKDMGYMFENAESFNQPLNWNLYEIENVRYMFANACNFKQSITWDLSDCDGTDTMFYRE